MSKRISPYGSGAREGNAEHLEHHATDDGLGFTPQPTT